jgi:hypothetical protein
MPIYGVTLIPRRCDVLDCTTHSSACLPQAGISAALYLSVFEQPVSRVFFGILPVQTEFSF